DETAQETRSHFSDNPRMPVFIDAKANLAFLPFQTFSLDSGGEPRIKIALLDRFLACMKPASITQRPPCAGVFFFA
ncbi:MAG: hypothetical protein KDE06_18700, partial [Rhodobacteraceae bacterium]|nr:hypothetical protein [Paracoccaceae bacterium]